MTDTPQLGGAGFIDDEASSESSDVVIRAPGRRRAAFIDSDVDSIVGDAQSCGTTNTGYLDPRIGDIVTLTIVDSQQEGSPKVAGLALCTHFHDFTGSLMGLIIESSDDLARAGETDAQMGFYLTNTHIDCSSGLVLSFPPECLSGLYWESLGDDNDPATSQMRMYRMRPEYIEYIKIMRSDASKLVNHSLLRASFMWLHRGHNSTEDTVNGLVEELCENDIEPLETPVQTICGVCRLNRWCTHKCGDIMIGSRCIDHVEDSLPVCTAIAELRDFIVDPFVFTRRLEELGIVRSGFGDEET